MEKGGDMERERTKKPFLVQSADYKTIFRVVDLGDDIQREAVARILEGLPITFDIRQEGDKNRFNYINEPLEVYAYAQVVYIYPPRHRIIACFEMQWHRAKGLRHELNIHAVNNIEYPGGGQICTCIHFDPKVFGVEVWSLVNGQPFPAEEIEIDIHTYPRGKEKEPKLKALHFGKHNVKALLDLIAGGEVKPLTAQQVEQWRELIMYAVEDMRLTYENLDVAEDYPVRVYFKPDWEKIQAADNDNEKLADALNGLRSAIEWE